MQVPFVDGVYTLTYSAIDGSGNEGQVQRVVTVLPREGSLFSAYPFLRTCCLILRNLSVPIQMDGFDQVGYFDFWGGMGSSRGQLPGVEGASYQEGTTPWMIQRMEQVLGV